MKKIIFLFILIASTLSAQKVLDKIIAVVDNEIILQSELDLRVSIEAAQRNVNPADSTVRRNVLNGMIEEKLLYAQAELDSVTVTDDQVKQQLESKMNYIVQQYGSRERVEQVYGMQFEKLKRSLLDDTRKEIMAYMLQQKKFATVEATRKEVEEFYDSYKDSLGVVQEKFTISHIFQNPKTGERVKKKAKELAISLLDSLKHGSDFAKLAKKYSEDPGSASLGGDLGTVKRGQFVSEVEAATFALAPNQISGVVESIFGFHIIQLLERRGESVHARHILIKVRGDDESDLKSIEFLTDLRDSITKKVNTFEYYAKKYSDDKENAKYGGELGSFEASQLDKTLLDIIYKLKEGDISYPKRLEVDRNTYGYHLVRLDKRVPTHKANLELDFPEIKRVTEVSKKQKLYSTWMKEIKNRIFWEIRL
jgi:peptidyl-prolyl cis-trans isomerase SurA